MTEEEAVAMLLLINDGDPETAHADADDILLKFLEEHGYTRLVTTFKEAQFSIPFWYA